MEEIRFWCGRCRREGKQVVPIAAKGEAVMLQAEDGLMHFRWATRPEGIVELDLILFEGDASWKRVGKVHDGRVFYLDWINGDQKEFFWMQGADDSKDDDVFEKINNHLKAPAELQAILNAPATPAATPSAAPVRAPAPAVRAEPPATPALSSGTSGAAGNRSLVSQDFLSNLLSQFPQQGAAESGPSLLEVFDSRALAALTDDTTVREALLPLLPELDRSPRGLREFLRSPQFQQAVQTFDAAVRGGHMQNILRQMGIQNQEQDASIVGSFLKSIEKALRKPQ